MSDSVYFVDNGTDGSYLLQSLMNMVDGVGPARHILQFYFHGSTAFGAGCDDSSELIHRFSRWTFS